MNGSVRGGKWTGTMSPKRLGAEAGRWVDGSRKAGGYHGAGPFGEDILETKEV